MEKVFVYTAPGIVVGMLLGYFVGQHVGLGRQGEVSRTTIEVRSDRHPDQLNQHGTTDKEGDHESDSTTDSVSLDDLLALADGPYSRMVLDLHGAIQSKSAEQLSALVRELEGSTSNKRYQILSVVFQRWVEVDPDGVFAYAATASSRQRHHVYSSALAHLAGSDPDRALREFDKLEPHVRTNSIHGLVMALAEQRPDEAFKILSQVPKNWGGAHGQFFQSICEKNPAQALSYLQKIERPGKRREALQGIVRAWTEDDPQAALAMLKQLPNALERTQAMQSYLQTIAIKDPERALEIAETESSSGNRSEAIGTVISAWFYEEPDAALRHFKTLSPIMQNRVGSDHLVWELSRHPERALDLLKDLPKGEFHDSLLEGSLANLTDHSPEKAKAFVGAIDDPKERKTAAEKFAGSLSDRDPSAAASYVKNFKSEDLLSADVFRTISQNWAQRDPLQALEWASSLDPSDQRASALQALVGPLAERDPQSLVKLLRTESNEESQKKWIASATEHLVRADSESAERLVEFLPEQHRAVAMGKIIQHVASQDPKAAAGQLKNLIEGLGEDLDMSSLIDSSRTIASSWSRLEPENATRWAANLPDEKTREKAVESAIGKWIEDDSLAASEWISELDAGATRDAAVGKLVLDVRNEDPEAGFAWAASISDDEARANNLKWVINTWKSKDKEAATDAVVNGGFSEDVTQKLLKELE
ncbi:MAG: hypothetical protein KDN22_33425 [Verrucomicrobiae bacterium]|nr:hypothetical protein [Verrucomicrobiae bacterium]